MAQDGGVLVRAGHTEAGCDLARLAGLTPAAVICEILKDNGEMARLPDLIEFAAQHKLKIGTIADLIQHRSQTESLVTRVAERDIETAHGTFRLHVYSDRIGQETHLALVQGQAGRGQGSAGARARAGVGDRPARRRKAAATRGTSMTRSPRWDAPNAA